MAGKPERERTDGLRPIHPDFRSLLDDKGPELADLFADLREFVLGLYPESNELLYHTHALTAVFSVSERLSDAFCHIPVYSEHINLGFNKGTLLRDPHGLLKGTGKLIRHVGIAGPDDYRNPEVTALTMEAIAFAVDDMDRLTGSVGKTISKIKRR